jgi:hypothetical protein
VVWGVDLFGHLFGKRIGISEQTELEPREADELARLTARGVDWHVEGLVGTGVLTVIGAWPKAGKSYAFAGLMRAMQDGATFFGRQAHQGRALYLSEETAAVYADKVRAFGLRSDTLVTLHHDAVAGWTWESLVERAGLLARRHRCAVVVVDTLSTWCPGAMRSPEAVAEAVRPLRRLTAAGLGVVVIAHSRKAGGDGGLALLGSVTLAGAFDVLANFGREKESSQCHLSVVGRYGEWAQTAYLDGHRYLTREEGLAAASLQPGQPGAAVAEELTVVPAQVRSSLSPPSPSAPSPPRLSPVLRETLAHLRAGGPQTPAQLQAGLGIAKATASERLNKLEALGLVMREGKGQRFAPQLWRVADAPRSDETG